MTNGLVNFRLSILQFCEMRSQRKLVTAILFVSFSSTSNRYLLRSQVIFFLSLINLVNVMQWAYAAFIWTMKFWLLLLLILFSFWLFSPMTERVSNVIFIWNWIWLVGCFQFLNRVHYTDFYFLFFLSRYLLYRTIWSFIDVLKLLSAKYSFMFISFTAFGFLFLLLTVDHRGHQIILKRHFLHLVVPCISVSFLCAFGFCCRGLWLDRFRLKWL